MKKIIGAFSAAVAIAAHNEIATMVIIIAWMAVAVRELTISASKHRTMWWEV